MPGEMREMGDNIGRILKRLIAGKSSLRRERANLPFEEKIKIVIKLQEIAENMRQSRGK
jgi:hypothetical protein